MKKLVLITLSFIAVLTACKDEAAEFITAENGVKYMLHRTSDTGYQIHYEEGIYFNIKVRDEDGNMMINVVDSMKGHPSEMLLKDEGDSFQLHKAFILLKAGDSATFMFNTADFFGPPIPGQEYPGGLKADQTILVDIGIIDVIPFDTLEKARIEMELQNAEAKRYRDSIADSHKATEESGMDKYFREKGLANVKTLETGTMIAINKKGSGARAEAGDKVTVSFNIKTLAGEDVMNTDKQGGSYTFAELGKAVVGEVYGLHDAVAEMSEGGEATIAIPFMRGFGDRKMSETVPAYSTLVGTIKVIKVEKK